MSRSIWNFAFIFGLVFAVIGILMLLHHAILRSQCTERTSGRVESGDIRNREAALMLTFTANGEAYRLPFSYSNKISVGDTVTVAYNPAKISTYSLYILEDAPNTTKMGIICIVAGVVGMLIGYGVSMGLFPEVWKV